MDFESISEEELAMVNPSRSLILSMAQTLKRERQRESGMEDDAKVVNEVTEKN